MANNIDRLGWDTIAAIATGMTQAGVGIIRVSGPDAFACIEKIYRTANGRSVDVSVWDANTIHYGYIVDDEESIIDEVLVSIFRAPRSYTAENTIEINTHGGIYIEQKILRVVLAHGVRMAEPGEFTKRAFLNGRLDLTRAEAVMDLIASQNEYARRTALSQLQGSVSNEIRELRERILYEIAFIESALDDPENYDTEGYPAQLREKVTQLVTELERLLQVSQSGRVLKEGIRTAIVGRPNAGKSSLMNLLLGQERAIVTDIAGTTRDTLEETARLGNIVLHLIDTAGIHDTNDPVEQIGIARAQAAIDQSSLILYLIDRSDDITEEDRQIADQIRKVLNEDSGRRCIILLNKSDLADHVGPAEVEGLFSTNAEQIRVIETSLKDEKALERITTIIEQTFYNGLQDNDEVLLSNEREMREASAARDSLWQVIRSIDLGMTEDFYSSDLMDAYTALGRILGESVEDDLVEEIFSKFCLGK